jgi:tetratricopeptide (TPR) repeat protein
MNLLAWLLLPALQDEGEPLWRRLERESLARREQQLHRAVEEASGRLEKNSKDVEALVLRGTAYFRLHRREPARQDLELAVRVDPRRAGALLTLGELLLEDEEYGPARELLTRALDVDPRLAQAFLFRGRACERDKRLDGRYEKAAADYTSAIELDPKLLRAFLLRAGVLDRLQKRDRVADAVREFLKAAWPEIVAELDAARKRDSKKYRELLREALERFEHAQMLREANPEEFDLVVKLQAIDRRTGETARRLRETKDEEERSKLRAELRELLSAAFELRQALQKRDLDDLQRRIDEVRAAMREQAAHRDKVVDERLRDLEKQPPKREKSRED